MKKFGKHRFYGNKGKNNLNLKPKIRMRFEQISKTDISVLMNSDIPDSFRHYIVAHGANYKQSNHYIFNKDKLEDFIKQARLSLADVEISYLEGVAEKFTMPLSNEIVFYSKIIHGEKDMKKAKYKIRYVEEIEHPPSIDQLIEEHPQFNDLYQFQIEGVKYGLSKFGRCIIGDEMGVGKTVQALAICTVYKEEWPCLILCPSSLKYNWMNEIATWLKDLVKSNEVQIISKSSDNFYMGSKFIIISYELAKRIEMVKKIQAKDFKIGVADEAHYLKSFDSQRSKYLIPILQKCKRSIMLTGTPALARPRELFNMLKIIRPDIFVAFQLFGNRYCDPKYNFYSKCIEYNGAMNKLELHYILSQSMIRRLKKEVLKELPPKNRFKQIVSTEQKVVKKIKALQNKLEDSGENIEKLISMMLAGGKSSLEDHSPTRVASSNSCDPRSLMNQIYTLMAEAKLKGVCEFLETYFEYEKQYVVFAHHRSMIDGLEAFLKQKKQGYMRIDGSVAPKDREARVSLFQKNKNTKFALLSITSCSEGLTLTASSTVIFAELYWTPAKLIQAEDRVHRITQEENVDIYYLMGKDTLDNLIFSKVKEKFNLTSEIMDGAERRRYYDVKEVDVYQTNDQEETPFSPLELNEFVIGYVGKSQRDSEVNTTLEIEPDFDELDKLLELYNGNNEDNSKRLKIN